MKVLSLLVFALLATGLTLAAPVIDKEGVSFAAEQTTTVPDSAEQDRRASLSF